MASSKRGAPTPMGLSPRGVPHSGFLVFSEVRGSKLDCNAEKKAAFEDDEILKKEVKAYNKSIVEKRSIRYENLLEMSRMDLLAPETYVRSVVNYGYLTNLLELGGTRAGNPLERAGKRAGLEQEHFWDRPIPFWWGFCSEELMAMYKITEGSFSIDIMEVKELMRRISEAHKAGIDVFAGRHEYWAECGAKYPELGLNAHLSDEYEKMQALIQPKDDVEVYERMRLFQAVVDNAVKVQEILIEDAKTAEL